MKKLKKTTSLILLAFVTFAYSGVSSAISSADQANVTAAFSEGTTSVGLVVTGIIAIGAVLTGLGLIVKWLAK